MILISGYYYYFLLPQKLKKSKEKKNRISNKSESFSPSKVKIYKLSFANSTIRASRSSYGISSNNILLYDPHERQDGIVHDPAWRFKCAYHPCKSSSWLTSGRAWLNPICHRRNGQPDKLTIHFLYNNYALLVDTNIRSILFLTWMRNTLRLTNWMDGSKPEGRPSWVSFYTVSH